MAGLTDIIKRVAGVFADSSAPGIINDAAQYGAKQFQGMLNDIPGIDFSSTMNSRTGGDPFSQTMNMSKGTSDPFSQTMNMSKGKAMFTGGGYGGSGGSVFSGNGFDAFRNPWSLDQDGPFSGFMRQQKEKEQAALAAAMAEREQAQSNAGGTGVTGPLSGVQGNPSGAQVERIAGTNQWDDMINRAAAEAGIPASVLKAQMAIESGGNNPSGPNYAGATGLMQIVPKWWQETANKYGGDLNDPWTNIRTAADIMAGLYKEHGTWERAATAYFTGSPDLTGAADAYSTDYQYVEMFKNNIAYIEQQMQQQQQQGQGVTPSGSGGVFPVKGHSGQVDLHWGEHPGATDIFAPRGTDVLAIRGGNAVSGYSDIGGYWTMITGDDGLVYYYAHQDRMGPNGRIEAGGYIGGVGDTGNAKGTDPHVHLGIATQGHGIINGTGPSGGAGDINVIEFLKQTQLF